MAMGPCNNCLERRWKFEKIEAIIRATCQVCGYEVEFYARGNRPRASKVRQKLTLEQQWNRGLQQRMRDAKRAQRVPYATGSTADVHRKRG